MRKLLYVFLFMLCSLSFSNAQTNGDYQTNGSVNFTSATNWQVYNSGWVAASSAPTSSDGVITILNGNTATVTSSISLDQLVVASGGSLVVDNSQTLTISDGSGDDLTNSGTITVNGSLQINGTYNHTQNGGTIPTATWNATSTCLISGITSTAPAGLSQTFGNVTFTCSLSSAINLNGALTTVKGNLTINHTGNIQLTGSSTASVMTVDGNFNMISGTINMSSTNRISGTINLKGNFSMSGGIITESASSFGEIAFNGSSSQNMTKSGGAISGQIRININNSNNVVLNSNFALINSNWLVLSLGALNLNSYTLTVNSTATIARTGGSLSAAPTFAGTVDLRYPDYTSQVSTSFELPSSGSAVRNLNLENPNGIKLDKNINVNGSFVVTDGNSNIDLNGYSISFGSNGDLQYNNGSVSQTTTSAEFPALNGPYSLLIANPNNVILHDNRTITGVLTLNSECNLDLNGKTLIIEGTTSGTGSFIGSSTSSLIINGTGAMGNLQFLNTYRILNNLTINRTSGGSVTLRNGLTIEGTFTLTAGDLELGTYTLTCNGGITTTAGTMSSAAGAASIVIGGTAPTSLTLPSVTNGITNLTIDRPSATVTLGGNISMTGTLTLTAGIIEEDIYDLSITNGSIIRSGGLLNDYPSIITNVNITYASHSAKITTGNEIPMSATLVGNVTINTSNHVELGSDADINGVLTFTSGNLEMNGKTLTLDGTVTGTGGRLSGTTTSNLVIGGTGAFGTLSFASGTEQLGNLTINRTTSGSLSLGSSLTVNGNAVFTDGVLSIGANTFRIDGSITYIAGSLTGGATSNLYLGGTTATNLNAITNNLNNLTIDKGSATVTLSGAISLLNSGSVLSLKSGSLDNSSVNITLANSATIDRASGTVTNAPAFGTPVNLIYSEDASAKSSGAELAANVNNLTINSSGGITLISAIQVNGNLYLTNGSLNVGAGPYLTMDNNSNIYRTGGSITDAPLVALSERYNVIYAVHTSALTTGKEVSSATDVLNVTVSNTNGITMGTNITVNGNLTLSSSCELDIAAYTLRLIGIISGTGTLTGNSNSILNFDAMTTPANATVRFSPSISFGDVIINRSGYSVYLNSDLSVDGLLDIQAGTFRVNDGFALIIEKTGILQNSGVLSTQTGNPYIAVFGVYKNSGTTSLGAGARIGFWEDGKYEHHFTTTAGTIPTATWGDSSVCEIIGYTSNSTAPGGLLINAFNDFIWNCTSQTTNMSLAANLQIVNRDLIFKSTGTGAIRYSLNTVTPILSIGRNLDLQGGVFIVSGGSSLVTIELGGDFIMSGGTLTEISSGNGTIVFFSTSPTYNKTGGIISNAINFTISNGTTLDLGASRIIEGGGSFTVQNGGTVKIGHINGIDGNLQNTGSKVFENTSTVIFNGSAAQVTGNSLITAGNVTVDNANGLTLSANTTLNGTCVIDGGYLQIPVNKALTTSGILNNVGYSGLVIKSDVNGSGSLLTADTVSGRVERYVEGSVAGYVHYASSPIKNGKGGMIYEATDFVTYQYNHVTQAWNRYWATPTNPLAVARGYYIAPTATRALVFSGEMNTGTIDYDITGHTSNGSGRWIFVGNPYPAAISKDVFLADNFTANSRINNKILFWDDDGTGGSGYSTSDYAECTTVGCIAGDQGNTPTGNIASGQGFMVDAQLGSTIVRFSNNMKVTTNDQFFIPDVNQIQKFYLNVMDTAGNFNQILLAYFADASDAYDEAYDSRKTKGNKYLALYSLINADTNEYSIQSRSPFMKSDTVAIGLDANLGGLYTFEFDRLENFNNLVAVYLVDKVTGTTTNLFDTKTYSFTNDKAIIKDRFYLVFNDMSVVSAPDKQISDPENSDISIKYGVSKGGNVLFVNLPESFASNALISIYDMQGKEISVTKISRKSNSFPVSLVHGVYLIKIQAGNEVYTEKIVVSE